MARVYRIFWGERNGRIVCTLFNRSINNQSVVIVTASEGDRANNTNSPQRFVGDANIRINNIAPFNGGVRFVMIVEWYAPLPVWTDVFVADEFPHGFFRAG